MPEQFLIVIVEGNARAGPGNRKIRHPAARMKDDCRRYPLNVVFAEEFGVVLRFPERGHRQNVFRRAGIPALFLMFLDFGHPRTQSRQPFRGLPHFRSPSLLHEDGGALILRSVYHDGGFVRLQDMQGFLQKNCPHFRICGRIVEWLQQILRYEVVTVRIHDRTPG